MPLSTDAIKQRYPVPAYNFRVTIEGEANAVRFARVSGLERQHDTLTYRDGLTFREGERIIKYFIDRYKSLTLERGVVASDSFFQVWLEQKARRAMQVSLCDEAGVPIVVWRVAKAYAVKLTAPRLDAQTNEVAIDSLEVLAAGITIVHL